MNRLSLFKALINKTCAIDYIKKLTTTTLLDASRTCTTGFLYLGAIFTAVCCLDVVAPPDIKYYFVITH